MFLAENSSSQCVGVLHARTLGVVLERKGGKNLRERERERGREGDSQEGYNPGNTLYRIIVSSVLRNNGLIDCMHTLAAVGWAANPEMHVTQPWGCVHHSLAFNDLIKKCQWRIEMVDSA